jgi:glycosyltransferase involved in cell wall biosynthesis
MTTDILFDASRLISRTERDAPTGVDRVCLAYAEWILDRPDLRLVPVRSRKDQLVAVDGQWFERTVRDLRRRWTRGAAGRASDVETRLFAALNAENLACESIRSPPPEPDQPDSRRRRRLRLIRQFVRSRNLPEIPAGRAYFNVGHTSLNTPDILTSLARSGVDSVVLLHDLIPITHPEYCRPGDGEKHRARVVNALTYASRILVNSEYTGFELERFARTEGLRTPPIDAVHLGLEPGFSEVAALTAARPYFVHVGTIEARKNLAFLLSVWRRLQERMGERAPQLVLVGRWGWENEAVLDHFERSPNLRGLVHQAADLGDEALTRLMAGARAVLAPSSVEGFDLPAVEASALGAPLIASDIPAHRELVPHARLVDPLDGPGWLAALEEATLQRPVAPPYQPPTWPGHFAEVERRLGI